ncbi:MAG: hypothetical protein HKN86_05510 [Acidimicrobiia bacterium]|nr:hypothetical protein [Acidimicrobiia bacterium]
MAKIFYVRERSGDYTQINFFKTEKEALEYGISEWPDFDMFGDEEDEDDAYDEDNDAWWVGDSIDIKKGVLFSFEEGTVYVQEMDEDSAREYVKEEVGEYGAAMFFDKFRKGMYGYLGNGADGRGFKWEFDGEDINENNSLSISKTFSFNAFINENHVAPETYETGKDWEKLGSRFRYIPFDEFKSRQVGKPDFKTGKMKDIEVEQWFTQISGQCDGRLQAKILKGFDKYGKDFKQSGDNMETYKSWIVAAMVRCGFMVEGEIQEDLIENITPSNMSGMGPVALPVDGADGSGDVPAAKGDAEEEFKKAKKEKMARDKKNAKNESFVKSFEAFSFDFEGVDIKNPFTDETARMDVDPTQYYGKSYAKSDIKKIVDASEEFIAKYNEWKDMQPLDADEDLHADYGEHVKASLDKLTATVKKLG